MAIERDMNKKLTVASVTSANKAQQNLANTKKYTPPKPAPLKITSRPQQNIQEMQPSTIPTSKIGDLKRQKSYDKFVPVTYEKANVKVKDPATGLEYDDYRAVPKYKLVFDTAVETVPKKKDAARLFYQVANASPDKARSLYGQMTERDLKAFWSYAVANGKLNTNSILDDYKADREKYAGAEYYPNKTALEKHVEAQTKKQVEIAKKAQQAPLQNQTKPSENDALKAKMESLYKPQISAPAVSGRGMNPRALPLNLTPQQQEQQRQQYAQELQQATANPNIQTKVAAGLASGLTAGLSEAGMTPEQRARYQQTVGTGLPYMVGQGIGMIGGGGVAEGALRAGGKLAGETLAKQVARGALIGGTQQGVMSATEGKTPIQIAQDVALTAGLGAVADVGLTKLFGAIAKKYGSKAVTPEVKQAIENETRTLIEQNGYKVMSDGSIYKDGKLLKKSEKVRESGVVNEPIQMGVRGQLPEGTMKPEIGLGKPKISTIPGKYEATSKPYMQAITDEIEKVQNFYRHNDIIGTQADRFRLGLSKYDPSTMDWKDIVKAETGVNVNNIEKGLDPVKLSEIGKEIRLARAAGVAPNIRIGKEKIELAPKPLIPKGKQVERPFTLTPAESQRIKSPTTTEKTLGGTETLPKAEKPFKATTEGKKTITDVNEAIQLSKSKISTKPLAKQKTLSQKAADLYQGTVSTQAPIEKLGRLNVPGAKTVAQQAQNISQSGGTVDYILGKDLVGREGQTLGKGLNDSIKGLSPTEQSDLWDMMLHRHNIDRMNQGKPVFGDEISSETSANVVKQYEQNPKLVEAEKNVRKIIDTVTDEFAVNTGLVSKEAIDNLRNNIYKAYIPTYREMDSEALQLAKSLGGKILKKATGSSKNLLPPEQQVAAYINKVVRAGRKNEMYNGLLDLVMKNPDELAPFAQLSKTATERMKSETGDLLNDAIDGLDNNVKKISTGTGDKYQFTLYKNGEPVTLNVSEPMYKALNTATDDSTLTEIGDVFRKYATGPMKALITGYNPLFAVTNFMRDIPTALLYSNNAVKWVKNYPKALKEIATNGEAWKQYQALGGTRSGLFSYEKGVTLPANRNLAQNIGKSAVDTVGAIGNITEVLPRFTEYLATIEKMGNTLEGRIAGIANAAEITTNFARSGKLTKQVDAFVPYLNPAVQGIDRFYRAVRYNPIKTIAKGVGLMTVPTLILESINSKDPAFKEMNQRTKDAFYLVPNGKGEFIKVPKSRENAVVFSTLFEWLARASKGEPIDMSQAINTLKTNFSPGDPINSFVLTPLIKTFQQISNPKSAVKNYANMDIVPSNLRNLEAKYQYDATTRQLSKAIGEKLNVSPKVLDYLIDSYTGVIGQATRPSTTKTGFGSTFLNKFKADPVFQNDNINKLYDLSDKLTTVATTKNFTDKIPSKLVTPEEARKNAVNKVLTQISDLRKQQKEVESLNISMEEKKSKTREIQMKMNKLAGDALVKFAPNKKP